MKYKLSQEEILKICVEHLLKKLNINMKGKAKGNFIEEDGELFLEIEFVAKPQE